MGRGTKRAYGRWSYAGAPEAARARGAVVGDRRPDPAVEQPDDPARCARDVLFVRASTIVLPFEFQLVEQRHDSAPVCESRLPVGSSARQDARVVIRAARDGDALALPARSSLGWWVIRSPRPTAFSACTARFAPLLAREPGVDGSGSLDLMDRGRPRREVERLEDEAISWFGSAASSSSDIFATSGVRTSGPDVGVSRQPIRFIRVTSRSPTAP